MKKIIFLLILFSLNVMACESLKDDGLKDSLLFKDHGCLKITADTKDLDSIPIRILVLIY